MNREQYLKLINPAIEIVVKKHEDYNRETNVHTYFPFGDKSYVQMLHVKSQRLVSLNKTAAPANFESTKDTLLDMINYAVFYLEALEMQEKTKDQYLEEQLKQKQLHEQLNAYNLQQSTNAFGATGLSALAQLWKKPT